MQIVVFGPGGAGGYFGAQLALAGEEVRPEPVTSGIVGRTVVDQVRSLHHLAG